MKLTTLHVALPENWHEVPDMQPRLFRSLSEDSGCLQLSLLPALESPDDLLGQLRAMLVDQPDLGDEIDAATEETASGPMATVSYKHPHTHRLFQAWIIAGPATVFATYAMGASPARADYETRESANILRALRFVSTLDSFEAYAPAEEKRAWWKIW